MKIDNSAMNITFDNSRGGTLSQEDRDKVEAALTDAFADTDITTDVDVVVTF